tara:strand:- start:993 stop:2087 length:1095 start_codon:yes stop_codon:yes gene_type:complete
MLKVDLTFELASGFVKNFIFLTALFFLAMSIFDRTLVWADGSSKSIYSNNPIIAEVDGKKILLDDLKNAEMQEILMQLFQMQKNILKYKITEMLLQSHPQLKSDAVPNVTRKDILQFYNSQAAVKELGTLHEMEDRIRQFLKKSFQESYVDRVYRRALSEGWLVDYMIKPNDFKLVAEIGEAVLWSNGGKGKGVMLLEFSDFQCPFCKRVQKTLAMLRERYGDAVEFGYRHFPLPFHKQARGFAEAAECARDQGKFWEMQSLIYHQAPRMELNSLRQAAKKVGVKNLDEFRSCFKSGKYASRVLRDIKDGSRMGIQGTPTFIIGIHDYESATVTGEMFSGAVPEEKFIQTLEKYILLSKAESTH